MCLGLCTQAEELAHTHCRVALPLKGGPESGISDAALKSCQGAPVYTQSAMRKPWWSRA